MKATLAEALEERGYTSLTPVQVAVTKPGLEGADLLVSAQTGSGKTLGFGLAIAPVLLRSEDLFGAPGAPLGLVIAPTRELALQVRRELSWLYDKAGGKVASCVGGMDMRDERRALARGCHVVVATPGRLRDHILRGSIDLDAIRAVVLDEADEMLDLGFREDLEFILEAAPKERQTLLFSATVPRQIEALAQSYQSDAVRVVARSEDTQHADIAYRAMLVADRDAEAAVINTLRFHEAPNAIVFCNTREAVNRLTTRLSNRGFQVVALSGELSQAERSHALQAMRDGRARVCVATDVAARGIDLPNLDLVVHAQLPSNHETLLHRSGRTGRAGRKGVSALVVQPKFRKKAERLLAAGKIKAEWGNAPSAEAVLERDEQRLFSDPIWQADPRETGSGIVEKLLEQFSGAQIAHAFLDLYRAQHSAPEELTPMDAAPRARREFGPSIWFSLSTGRKAGADPRHILPMLCKAGGLAKGDIGAIRIQPEETFVEIAAGRVDAFQAALGPGAGGRRDDCRHPSRGRPRDLGPSPPRHATQDRSQEIAGAEAGSDLFIRVQARPDAQAQSRVRRARARYAPQATSQDRQGRGQGRSARWRSCKGHGKTRKAERKEGSAAPEGQAEQQEEPRKGRCKAEHKANVMARAAKCRPAVEAGSARSRNAFSSQACWPARTPPGIFAAGASPRLPDHPSEQNNRTPRTLRATTPGVIKAPAGPVLSR